MRKLALLVAMMAMGLLAVAPAIAQDSLESEQEGESGEVDQSFTVTGSGSNGNSCAPLQGSAQSGNSQNQIGVDQSRESEADDFEFEEVGSNITSSGSSSTECTQEVNQAASAAAAPKATPPPPPAPKAPPPPPPAPKAVAETPKAKAEAPKAVAETPKAKAEAPKAEAKKAEEKKAEQKKELPKTGGNGTASLFALGAGALLVAGGLLARRIVK